VRRPASTHSAAKLPAEDVRIARIGLDGDGIGAFADGTPVYVPLTLPDELVRVQPGARRGDGYGGLADAMLEPSAERVSPPCPHFGPCGGCTLQHWADGAYAAWKAGLLTAALRRAGFADAAPAPLVRTPPAARRRMDFAIRRAGALTLGLHQRRSQAVVDLRDCRVLHPTLQALLAPLRALLSELAALRQEGSAVVNLLDSGPDLLLRTDAPLTVDDRALLAAFAGRHGLPRIAWARETDLPEPAAQLRPAVTRLAGVVVAPPPGAFLQASAAGEAAIAAAVLAGLPDRLPAKARVTELYAGCGTLTFALAKRARVRAIEGDAAAVGCLSRAAGGQPIDVVRRDLARQPLQPREFAGSAAVVLDPPHAGAAEQMAPLAASDVRCVIYVSCNPAALERDARVLHAAGFRLMAATPIDQFLWSSRLESVSVFLR
jgi:23S rRNA (uracil1939-C5)-methyltransferase